MSIHQDRNGRYFQVFTDGDWGNDKKDGKSVALFLLLKNRELCSYSQGSGNLDPLPLQKLNQHHKRE